MAFKQVLKTYFQPSIKLIELSDFDNSKDGEGSFGKKNSIQPDVSQTAGTNKPFVKLAGQIVSNIDTLIIEESGFIPKLTLIFVDDTGEFSGNYFPKRNLMLSVFINGANPKFKPVRADYLITRVKTSPVKNRGVGALLKKGTTFIISAELFVPKLYNNVSKSYSSMTSTSTLQQVCKDLGLGYAQNDFTPSDTMTWINANTSPFNFIREVSTYAYQDENSFFDTFINKEMILTMVNVNEQLRPDEIDMTFINSSDPGDTKLRQDQKDSPVQKGMDEATAINFLTSKRDSASNPNYIYEAHLISDQGVILRNEGYKKQIYYYDHLEETEDSVSKFKTFFIAPSNTDGMPDSTMLIPDDEGMDEVGNKKWMNINYGNTHPRWNAARVFNSHNLKELEKIKLRVLLKGVNFQIIRGMAIPVLLTQGMAEKVMNESHPTEAVEPNSKNKGQSEDAVDLQLSGWYYVKEAKYTFDKDDEHKFYTELTLTRREWTPSKIKFTANA